MTILSDWHDSAVVILPLESSSLTDSLKSLSIARLFIQLFPSQKPGVGWDELRSSLQQHVRFLEDEAWPADVREARQASWICASKLMCSLSSQAADNAMVDKKQSRHCYAHFPSEGCKARVSKDSYSRLSPCIGLCSFNLFDSTSFLLVCKYTSTFHASDVSQ